MIPNGARRTLLVRTRRPLRRGDVIEVTAAEDRGKLRPDDLVVSRWRVRL